MKPLRLNIKNVEVQVSILSMKNTVLAARVPIEFLTSYETLRNRKCDLPFCPGQGKLLFPGRLGAQDGAQSRGRQVHRHGGRPGSLRPQRPAVGRALLRRRQDDQGQQRRQEVRDREPVRRSERTTLNNQLRCKNSVSIFLLSKNTVFALTFIFDMISSSGLRDPP